MKKISFFSIALVCVHLVHAQITGSVFRDYNGNGTQDGGEPLVSGVIVSAYSSSGLCGTTTSSGSSAPNYSLSGCGSAQVRVEFELPTASGGCVEAGIDYPALAGNTYGTSVQFVSGTSSNVNFAVNNPADYNTGAAGTDVYVPIWMPGDPLPGGSAVGAANWFVGYPYTNVGKSTPPAQTLNGATIGCTWGVAYSKQAGKIFTSAFLRRYAGLGTGGSGMIYMLTPTASSFTVSSFYDMDANGHRTRADLTAPAYGSGSSFSVSGTGDVSFLGVVDPLTGQPSGMGVIGSNVNRNLSTVLGYFYALTDDEASAGQVGRVGLGDLEISDDGKYLFVMNLYSKLLFRLELDDAYNPTSIVNVTSFPLPAIACTNGESRPFATKFYRGKLYVGTVCSGENGGTNADMDAFVFELNNPTGAASFTPTAILSVPLDYQKGHPNDSPSAFSQWYPWGYNTMETYQEAPILSDLEFSDKGDLILSFLDQNSSVARSTSGILAGDLLIAGKDCSGAYTIENNGSYTSNGQTFTGATNGQGPGGGEFFWGEGFGRLLFGQNLHNETAQGAMAILHGSGELYATVMDPLDFNSGGISKFSLTTGDALEANRYELYSASNPDFQKSPGLGDVELLGVESPLEIGNRVWDDTDNNGIQDAGEPTIDGVILEIYADFNEDGVPDSPVLGAVTTVGGQWFFNNSNIVDGDPLTPGNQAGLKFGEGYIVRVSDTQYNGTGSAMLAGKGITSTNIGGSGQPDVRDSDATLNAGLVQITLITGNSGESNHTYDIGFSTQTLPLELLSFTVELNEDDALLAWETTKEENVSHFEVARSLDNFDFENIKELDANGGINTHNAYSLIDKNAAFNNTDKLYYRLTVRDLDGSITKQNTIELNLNNHLGFAKAYPNPINDKLYIAYQVDVTTRIEVLNTLGEAVYNGSLEATTAVQTLSIDTQNWSNRIYFVRLSNKSSVKTMKVVK